MLDVGQILAGNIPFQILGQLLRRRLKIALVPLKDQRLIVLTQIIRKHIGAHQRLPALAQNIDGLLKELHLDPGHIVLLHLLHFLLDRCVQFVFELERLHVIHVAIVVVQIPGEGRAQLFLGIAGRPGLLFVVAIAVVPGGAMRLPGAETHPTEVVLAVLVFANLIHIFIVLNYSNTKKTKLFTHHMIASAVLFNRHLTLGALLGVRRYPVGRLRVVITLLDPFL